MFPVKRIKTEIDDFGNGEIISNSEELTIEETDPLYITNNEMKIEETDLLGITNADSDFLVAEVDKKIETAFESKYFKTEFDLEIKRQEQENNAKEINEPLVVVNGSESVCSDEFNVLSRQTYLDMKKRLEEKDVQLSQFLVEKEYLTYRITELTTMDSNSENLIADLVVRVAQLKDHLKKSNVKLQEMESQKNKLENDIDGLQKYICLLSTNNSKLKTVIEVLKEGDGKAKKRNKIKAEEKMEGLREDVKVGVLKDGVQSPKESLSSQGDLTNATKATDLQLLQENIRSLIADNTLLQDKLDKKTAQLKQTQEKFGKTLITFSSERRQMEKLKKQIDLMESTYKRKTVPKKNKPSVRTSIPVSSVDLEKYDRKNFRPVVQQETATFSSDSNHKLPDIKVKTEIPDDDKVVPPCIQDGSSTDSSGSSEKLSASHELSPEVNQESNSPIIFEEVANEVLSELIESELPETPANKVKQIPERDFCLICELYVLDFTRHIRRDHATKPIVQQILSLSPNSKERKDLLGSIRKKGNYLGNIQRIKTQRLIRQTTASD